MFGANSAASDTVKPSTAALADAIIAKFLISEDSSWITGQIIAVDGGRSKLS